MNKMEKLKKEWPHMAVLGASFLLLPALAKLTGEGAVLVVLLLLVFPLESLLCSFFAGKAGGFASVSYTHLDVYKRQLQGLLSLVRAAGAAVEGVGIACLLYTSRCV